MNLRDELIATVRKGNLFDKKKVPETGAGLITEYSAALRDWSNPFCPNTGAHAAL